MATPDGCNDVARVSPPSERSWFLIVLLDEGVDGGLQVDDGLEDAIFQAPSAELCEEALDGVVPWARSWDEGEGPARMADQPGALLGQLLGGIVDENDVDGLVGWHFGLDCIDEPDERPMPVALHVGADHRAVKDVERAETGE